MANKKKEIILAEGGEMPEVLDAPVLKATRGKDWHKEAIAAKKEIAQLINDNVALVNELELVRGNAQSAFAQANKFRDEYTKMQHDYQERLRFCDEQIIGVAKAIGVVVRGEL
jgi:hypothetical protein